MLTANRGRRAREFRRVVDDEVFFKRPGVEYYRLRLECGHEEERRVRARQKLPKRVRCRRCEWKGSS